MGKKKAPLTNAAEMMIELDKDGDDQLNFKEFMAPSPGEPALGNFETKVLRKLFDNADKNGDGEVGPDELPALVQSLEEEPGGEEDEEEEEGDKEDNEDAAEEEEEEDEEDEENNEEEEEGDENEEKD